MHMLHLLEYNNELTLSIFIIHPRKRRHYFFNYWNTRMNIKSAQSLVHVLHKY